MSSVAFLGPQSAAKLLATECSPHTPLGELTALPQILQLFLKSLLLRPLLLREGRCWEEKGAERGGAPI